MKYSAAKFRLAFASALALVAMPSPAAPNAALVNSWFLSGQGQNAQVITAVSGGTTTGPSTTWTVQTTAVLGDVQKVQSATASTFVYVSVPELASYVMGPFWNNTGKTVPFVNMPKSQNGLFKIAYTSTYPSASHGTAGNGPVGLLVNGVVIYNAGDAFTYSHSTSTDANPGDGIWNRMAQAVEATTFDHALAHQPGNGQYHNHVNPTALRAQLNDNVDYVGTTNFFPYDPAAYWLTHGTGADGTYVERTTNLHHSPIVGWMFDGYPIYGPYGYSTATDPNSAVTRMRSSFSLRTDLTTGSARIAVPGWSAVLDTAKLGAAGTAPGALYTMTTAEQASYAGPNVSTTFPLGRYGEDYAFVSGSGDLDQWNGRWCVTPEFPGGTYAYFITIDAAGAPAFPYIVNRQYYGPNNGSGAATLSESVTVTFDVATDVAPVVAGPATGSVAQGGTLAFTAASLFSVSDKDAAAMESVTITASSGTVSVDRSGILASQTNIVSGANGTSTVTLSGAIRQLNAALATLTFTAPASGSSATISVQANDGSASNNLSNSLNTAITLTSPNTPPTISAITAATVVKNNATPAISFTIGDVETAAASLTLSGSSSNTTLVPNSNIVFGGSGANRTVTVTPAVGQIGSATITVTVSDGTGTTSTTFTLTVKPPNILLIIADDYGLDASAIYNPGGNVAPTPNIASLASGGVRFNKAYAYTVCSPTRSAMLTGRYGFRTGTANVAGGAASNNSLKATEFTLPEAFAANSGLNYQLKHIGKWHLGGGNTAPGAIGGWPSFAGYLAGQVTDYYSWPKVITDGTAGGTSTLTSTTYITTDLVNDAVSFINTQTAAGKPWVAWVAFSAPHITQNSPFYQKPPTALLSAPYDALSGTNADILANPISYYNAIVQALDTEIGRLLLSVDLTKTDVIFIGDNGTPGGVLQSPYPAGSGKATLSEGGIRVPMIIRGPDVVSPGRQTDVLTHVVDLYSTILELAGINVASTTTGVTLDSQSLMPVLQNQAVTRNYVFGDYWDLAFPTLTDAGRVIRDTQYKLVRLNDGTERFYDLTADPYEATNLIAGGFASMNSTRQAAYTTLSNQLATYNTPPTITAVANQTLAINTATGALPFTIGDAELNTSILSVTGTSSNTTLVPTANVVIGGADTSRTVTVTPATGQTGASTITLSVTDGTFTTNTSFTVTVGSVTTVGTPSISPAAPTNTDPVTVTATVTPASGRSITGVSIQYNSSTPATSTVFNEPMSATAIASPWTGTGTSAAWSVVPPTGAPFSQTAAANNTPAAVASPSFGMELNGGAPPPINGNTRITTTNTINAATINGNATTAGYVEFYMMTANLSGSMGWDFQTSPDGTNWTTRLSELTGNNHGYPATPYHYDLTSGERVSTLQLRFRFAGTGPTGTTISKFSLDDIKVVTSTGSSPATIAMTGPSGGGTWTATIPAQPAGTVLNYTITATDSASATATNTGSYTVATAAPVLSVTPASTLASSGAVGSGTFTPSSIAYTLTNTGTGTMSWAAGKTQAWLDLSATSGTIAAGATATVNASINAANANSLTANTYNDTITFTNTTNNSGTTTRTASLLLTNGVPTAPAAPVIATLPVFSAGTSKTISWPAVATATSYTLQIASSANFTTNLLSSQVVTTPSGTFTNLADGVTYYYRVLATNSIGSSAFTNTVSSTQDTGLPGVTITSPARGTSTASSTITVTGTASDSRSGISGVKVNNVAATSSNNFATWIATVPLGFGTNVITATATDGAGNQATTFATSLTSAVTVTMTTPQTYNPLIIPDTITGTNFNLDLYQVNKQFPTWTATNATLGLNSSTTLGASPGTTTLGYNGALMWGPTLIMNKGDTVQLNVTNHLDQSNSTLLRSTTTTVHWHGFHIPAIMDGGPRQVIPAGTTWSPTFKVMNDAATYWYHPHLHMATQEQLTLGAGGMIIVRDPVEAALNLPRTYGVDDIPLAVTTRRLLSGNNEFSANQYVQADGSTSSTDNYGDYVLVNGTMNPQVSLPKQFVRLRILCADIQRGYRVGFSDNRNFYVIANDQGLLNAPVLVSQVTMMIGERVEILVDLSNDTIGSSLDIMAWDNLGTAGALNGSLGGFGGSESNTRAPNGNSGPENGGLLCNSDFKLVHINVAAATANPVTSVPTTLANNTYLTASDATTTRTINIANGNGGTPGFTFDGIAYSPTTNNFTIPLNAVEKWTFNGGQVFGHAIHIHDIKFKIVSRSVTQSGANTNQIFDTIGGVASLIGTKPCANYESGWKDTLYVPRGESVSVVAKYDDFASPNNPYMLHCHMLNHEDGGLMGQFVVTNSNVPEAIAVASVTRTGSNSLLNFQFNTTPGTSFLVQYSPDMTTGSWTTIGTTTGNSDGTGATFTELDATRLALPRGFYRTVLQATSAPPVISSAATATATRGAAFSYQIAATNTPTGYGAILLSGNTALPGGLTVNPNTGLVSGTVPTGTAAGTYNISVSASNSGGTTHKTVVLTVN